MLYPLAQLIEKPNDIPDMPRPVKDYLQARFNSIIVSEYDLPAQRAAGFSEQYCLGFLMGLQKAANILDEMEFQRNQEEV